MITIKKGIIKSNNKEIQPNEIWKYLTDTVEVAEGVKFKDIFDIVIINKNIFETIFYSSLGGYPLDYFISEYTKEDDDEYPSSITYLEVYNATDLFNYHKNEETEIMNWVDFHGICVDTIDVHFNDGKPFDQAMGISFTPINQLKKYSFRINNKISYQNYNSNKKEFDVCLKGERLITVYEMFHAILHEISWHGSPEQRDERRDDLNRIAYDLKTGKEKTYELKFDGDDVYFIDDEGNRDYLFKKDDES